MNKIFTLLSAAVVAMSASAVELTVVPHSGTLMPDGNVLFNTPDPEWLQDGEVWISGSLSVESDQPVAVDVTATLVSGFEKYGICFDFCAPVAVGNSASVSKSIGPGNPFTMSVEPAGVFSEPWTPDVVRTYKIDVNIASSDQTLKEFSIFVTNDENASVGRIMADAASFSISGRDISWNLSEAPGMMVICSPDGRLVYQKYLSNRAGSISLSLPAGLYIWATPAGSGKIIIRD